MPVAQDTRLDTFLRAAWRRFKGAQKGELSIIVLANVSRKSIILYNITNDVHKNYVNMAERCPKRLCQMLNQTSVFLLFNTVYPPDLSCLLLCPS